MFTTHYPIIFEEKQIDAVAPAALDEYLSQGWRHFGRHFYRYSISIYQQAYCRVLPLRVALKRFAKSRKQKKIARRGQRFTVSIQPAKIDDERNQLFHLHKARFKDNVPESLTDFLSPEPGRYPTKALEVEVRDHDKLIALSYFDVSAIATSSIYGMFDPDYQKFSLGIFTLLQEINYALSEGKVYHYLGYGYDVPSFYDYKKKFHPLEYYDWKGQWRPHTKADFSWNGLQ